MKHFSQEDFLKLPPGIFFVFIHDELHYDVPPATQLAIKGESTPDTVFYQLIDMPMLRNEDDHSWSLPAPDTPLQLVDGRDGSGEDPDSEDAVAIQRPLQDTYLVLDPEDYRTLSLTVDGSCNVYITGAAKSTRKRVAENAPGNIHVDDFIDRSPHFLDLDDADAAAMRYLHFKLVHFRMPSSYQMAYRSILGDDFPLYVDYNGQTWKVTGASRMGDVMLARDLKAKEGEGYDERVTLNFEVLTNFRRTLSGQEDSSAADVHALIKSFISDAVRAAGGPSKAQIPAPVLTLAVFMKMSPEQQQFAKDHAMTVKVEKKSHAYHSDDTFEVYLSWPRKSEQTDEILAQFHQLFDAMLVPPRLDLSTDDVDHAYMIMSLDYLRTY